MGLWAPRFQAVWREKTPLYRPPQFVRRRIRAPSRVSLYDLRVGSRIIRRRNDAAVHRREALTFWAILLAIGLPMILAVALVAMDMRRDLSEMRSTGLKDDRGAVPVAWPELKQGSEFSGRVRMIGYMMDEHRPVRDDSRVDTFILLPEAGTFLHPAHRIPNQMVVVWSSNPVVFRERDLVWVSGNLSRTLRKSGEDQPNYAMTFADVGPLAEQDIGKWFRP